MTTPAKSKIPAWLVVALLMPGCSLIGVEPDEIDVVDEGTSGQATNGESGSGHSDTGDENNGDGDGDPGDGDGDGETDPGDGDGDTAGDGDGDGDGHGDGDGDRDTGDGDGDAGLDCESFDPTEVEEAANPIAIPDVMSTFEGSCGSPGPDAVFSFTATADATYEFTLASDAFEGVLYLVEGQCDPLAELACEAEGQAITQAMVVDEVIYVIVDSDAGFGAATLTIAAI